MKRFLANRLAFFRYHLLLQLSGTDEFGLPAQAQCIVEASSLLSPVER